MCSPHYFGITAEYYLSLFIKRMGLTPVTHEAWSMFVEPLHHDFVQNIHPRLVEFIHHVIIPILFKLPHVNEYVLVINHFVVITKCIYYCI